MIQTVLAYIAILMLAALLLKFSTAPALFIIVAAALLVCITYDSLCEEKSSILFWTRLVLMTLFSLLAGHFLGFLVFYFQREVKSVRKIAFGTGLFFLSEILFDRPVFMPEIFLHTLLLLICFFALEAAKRLILWYEAKDSMERRRLKMANISELHEKRLNEELVKQNLMAERNARLVERENISRNIHNSVGHSITAAIMTLDAADMLYEVKPEEARKRMNDANQRIRGSLESIRRAVRVLDEENADLTVKDLKAELGTVITEFAMDTSIQIYRDFQEIADETVIPRDDVVFLTGALQEFLTNGVKHGKADTFFVMLRGDSAHVRLEIKDNGHSDFDRQSSAQRLEQGFGLKKIVSYVEKCGGKARFQNEDGFRAVVELPMTPGGWYERI